MRWILLLACAIGAAPLHNVLATTIDTVAVGHAGNQPDQAYVTDLNPDGMQFGAVAYEYRIGTYEVTNSQYAAFLNAKAQTDPAKLYSTEMGSNARGGIARAGSNGNYTYTARPNMGDKPVNFVSWFDAARFVNWMSNGQGNGNTENGTYTLIGGGAIPTNGNAVTRNSGATWFLPTENEWYKAAYFDPRTAADGGPAGDDHYWLFATKSDELPGMATADVNGNINNPGSNVANYGNGATWNSQVGNVTTVGSSGQLSSSYFGTSDQAGNVWEWTETPDLPFLRWARQGSWGHSGDSIAAFARVFGISNEEGVATGFRIAMVPEPEAVVLALMGAIGVGLVTWRANRRSRRAHHTY